MTDTPINLAKIREAKQSDRRDVLEEAKEIRLNDTDARKAKEEAAAPSDDADAAFKAYQAMAALILKQDISLQDTAHNLMVLLGEVLGMVGCADCRERLHYFLLRSFPNILEEAIQEATEFDDGVE
jgi:hypothetical protein